MVRCCTAGLIAMRALSHKAITIFPQSSVGNSGAKIVQPVWHTRYLLSAKYPEAHPRLDSPKISVRWAHGHMPPQRGFSALQQRRSGATAEVRGEKLRNGYFGTFTCTFQILNVQKT